jgi:hypothetical protein
MSIDAIFQSFNAAEVEPQTSRGLLEKGEYVVTIEKTSTKINRAGTGSYLELELQIVEGEAKGRRIWDRLNLDNPNQTAVDIAKASLSAICHSVGVLTPSSPEELKGIPLVAIIGIQPAKGEYSESNVVKGYAPVKKAAAPKASGRKSPAMAALDDDSDTLPF